MENKNIVLTASANVGIGLLTAICVGFANIFGVKSNKYNKKLQFVMDKIKRDLCEEMEKYPGIQFSDLRIVQDGKLAYTGTVIGYGPVEAKVVTVSSAQEPTKSDMEIFIENEMKKNNEYDFVEDPECRRINEEGRYYFNIKKDYEKAFELFEKASEGSPRAKYNLGFFCYYSGKGTKVDKEKGIELIKEAADAGLKTAVSTLRWINENTKRKK